MSDNKYYIVNEPILKIRMLTSGFLGSRIYKYTFGIILFYLLSETVGNIIGAVLPTSYFDVVSTQLPAELANAFQSLPYSAVLYTILMTGAFECGRTLYQLNFLRNGSFNYEFLFEGFSLFIRATIIYLLKSLLIAVGLMLFFAPGIFAYYYYRQAFFVLLENPKMGPVRCLRESRLMMRGNAITMFKLDFSYLLIYMLANIPMLLTAGMIGNTVIDMILYTLTRLPVYAVMANMFLSRTVFYELIISGSFSNFKYQGEEIFRNADRAS